MTPLSAVTRVAAIHGSPNASPRCCTSWTGARYCARKHHEIAGEVLRRNLAALLLPEADQAAIIITHGI